MANDLSGPTSLTSIFIAHIFILQNSASQSIQAVLMLWYEKKAYARIVVAPLVWTAQNLDQNVLKCLLVTVIANLTSVQMTATLMDDSLPFM